VAARRSGIVSKEMRDSPNADGLVTLVQTYDDKKIQPWLVLIYAVSLERGPRASEMRGW
jgi:hypothetical protein